MKIGCWCRYFVRKDIEVVVHLQEHQHQQENKGDEDDRQCLDRGSLETRAKVSDEDKAARVV